MVSDPGMIPVLRREQAVVKSGKSDGVNAMEEIKEGHIIGGPGGNTLRRSGQSGSF